MKVVIDAQSLGRSRFATSPAMEVLGLFRHRSRHPSPHARAWYQKAQASLAALHFALLEALVPDDHGNVPDFITPTPRSGESMEEIVARIAETPAEVVEFQLDIAIRGRRMWPEVLELHADAAAYERWRRPLPPALETLADSGGDAVAIAAAEAMEAFFTSVLAPAWPRIQAVLDADITHRADRMASSGAAALLDELGERMRWTGNEIVLDRTYSGVVDWADDGMLFVPATTHFGPVLFCAEPPHPPVLIYGARGISSLWERPAQPRASALADLIGVTRATLLTSLDAPRSTIQLSRELGWSTATISYHLGILLRGALVSRTRRGRMVLYHRTGLGSALTEMAESMRASG